MEFDRDKDSQNLFKLKNKFLNWLVNTILNIIIVTISFAIFLLMLTACGILVMSALEIMPPLKQQFHLYIAVMVFQGALVTICFNASNNSSDIKHKQKFYYIAVGFLFGLLNFGVSSFAQYLFNEWFGNSLIQELQKTQSSNFTLTLVITLTVFISLAFFIICTSMSFLMLWKLLYQIIKTKVKEKFVKPTPNPTTPSQQVSP